MARTKQTRSLGLHGTGMSMIYEASGAKMGTNAIYFIQITDT